MNANGRLCRRFAMKFRDVARIGRPIYRPTASLSVAEAIARERAQAKKAASIKKKK